MYNFLSTSEIPDDADAPGLREAREKLLFSKMNREEQLAYRRYLDDRVILADQIYTARGEGKLEGRAEGREEGREEGRAEERMANALSLLQNGVSKEIVVKSLKLSEEEAANLRI
jgi:predicted transposase YdaD